MPPAPHVLDDDLLPQHFGQPLGDDTPEQIGAAAGRERHHHGHRPLRPGLCGSRLDTAAEGHRSEKREQEGVSHGCPPGSVRWAKRYDIERCVRQPFDRPSVRHEHWQRRVGQDVAGCAAEDQLPQAALRVGALDQESHPCAAAAARIVSPVERPSSSFVARRPARRCAAGTAPPGRPRALELPLLRDRQHRHALRALQQRHGKRDRPVCSVLPFHAIRTLVAICFGGDGGDNRTGRPLSNRPDSRAR